jgi:hypothetical protein
VDRTRITELKAWAASLEERASSDELKAAGKAIAMLVNEVEELQAKLVSREAAAPPPVTAPPPKESPAGGEPTWAAADDRLSGSFFARLKRTLGFD